MEQAVTGPASFGASLFTNYSPGCSALAAAQGEDEVGDLSAGLVGIEPVAGAR